MTHDPDAKTLAVLIYEKLFTERRDAAYAWTDYVADLNQDGVQRREYSLYGWMAATGTPGWEFASD